MKVNDSYYYTRFTEKDPSITERVIKAILNLLKKLIAPKGNADWMKELSSLTKQFNNTIRHSIKTTIEASIKIYEKLISTNHQAK